ncbi:MAG: hypothetical protein JKY22_11070, partial [Flavobacteriaceae bacterium]|nr:hypothetical protein [Flavobacteriaceae bacterium]
RARILLTLTDYDMTIKGGNTPDSHINSRVVSNFPVNPKGRVKNQYGRALYGSHKRAQSSLLSIEKAILEGTTFAKKKDDWK